MRQQYEQSRRRQDDQAGQEAEDSNAAWPEGEARAQQHGHSLDREAGPASHAYPSARSGEQELRRLCRKANNTDDRELAKSMFPWLKL
jgi:hypothetical protein